MKYTKLKATGDEISRIALGCWKLGGGDYWGGYENEKESQKTVDTALDYGINFFDTAESYGEGESERFLGRAMKGRRSKFIVSTKIYLDKLKKEDVIKCCEESLVRMQTGYIDMLSPHFPSREIPFEETFEALELLKRQGKIRTIGVSNFGAGAFDKLNEIGKIGEIALNQLPYNLLLRAIEFTAQKKSEEYGIGMICYSTLAQGLLTGNYTSAKQVPEHLKVLRLFSTDKMTQRVLETIAAYRRFCKKEGLEMAPTALAWVLGQKNVCSILTGASNPSELMENLQCLDVGLSADIAEEITHITDGLKNLMGDNADMWNTKENSRIF